METKNQDIFLNRCFGIVIVKSENSNFNADFTGNPRRLPDDDGTIYATDKTLKYSIRRFWVDQKKDVFVWRSHKPNGNVRTRDQRMEQMKENLSNYNKDLRELIDFYHWLEENKSIKQDDLNKLDLTENDNTILNEFITSLKEKETKIIKDIIAKDKIPEIKKRITASVFANCIDTKLFGVTYTGEGPLSLTGPVQISYGVNKYTDNTNYILDILSPYPTNDEETTQSSIGKDKKTLESYYVYDVSINPQNILSHYNKSKDIIDLFKITDSDIDDLKEALKYSVTALDTTSKKDSENVLLLFVTMPKDSKQFLPALKNLVDITKEDDKTVFNLSKIKKLLENKNLEKVELYYNDILSKIEGFENENGNYPEKWKIDTNL